MLVATRHLTSPYVGCRLRQIIVNISLPVNVMGVMNADSPCAPEESAKPVLGKAGYRCRR